MTDLQIPEYRSPYLIPSGHIDTMIPHFFRRVRDVEYKRERIETPDGDFLDLDWHADYKVKKLAIFSHGLEGSSRGKYIQGMIPHFRQAGFDTMAWNFRGCSGEMNRLPQFYHSGASHDLRAVVEHVLQTKDYESIHLIGFSMGGNITLKYLGEESSGIDPRIRGAVAFSVPCDIASCARQLETPMGRLYVRKFTRTLNHKLKLKAPMMKRLGIDISGTGWISDFYTWDGRFTAPLHGFKDADDYYRRASSKQFLKSIRIPTLLVNAKNDPFLGAGCFPSAEELGPSVRLEAPAVGGHVGFASSGMYWSERLALQAAGHELNCARAQFSGSRQFS